VPAVQRAIKSGLTRLGTRCSRRTIHRLNAVVNYLEAGRWMRERGFDTGRRVDTREEIFELIAADVADEAVLYLEFGVFEGASMRTWSGLLRNPRAQLHGFDSFEGLPEGWSLDESSGHFSTRGDVPQIDDPRVRFFKGWFEDTLPAYEPPPHERLVVNVDADLYSSAALVLAAVEPWLEPGAYLYFDELNDRAHELRAFDEFLERTRMRFRTVAVSRELAHAAFRREA
jgi:hypothetical protein